MTDDRTWSTGGESSGQPQFLVEHGNKLYRVQAVEEFDPQDEQMQAMLSDASESGRAIAYSEMGYKGMEAPMAAANISPPQSEAAEVEAASFANINPPNEQ